MSSSNRPVNLSQIILATLLLLNLFTTLSIIPNVDAYKAKKILYGMAAAHLLGMLKNVKMGPPKVIAHPYPILPPPKPKCKKEVHVHEHVSLGFDKYGGHMDLDDDFDDHYSGGISSKYAHDDLDDETPYYDDDLLDDELAGGRGSLQLGKKLKHRGRVNRYLDESDAADGGELYDQHGEGLDDDEANPGDIEGEEGEEGAEFEDYAEATQHSRKRRPPKSSFKTPIKSGKKMIKKYIKLFKKKTTDSFPEEPEELIDPKGINDVEYEEINEQTSTFKPKTSRPSKAYQKAKIAVAHVAPPQDENSNEEETAVTEAETEFDEISGSESSIMLDNFSPKINGTKEEKSMISKKQRMTSTTTISTPTTTSKPFMIDLKEKGDNSRPKSIKAIIKKMHISNYVKTRIESISNKTAEVGNWFRPGRRLPPSEYVTEDSNRNSTTSPAQESLSPHTPQEAQTIQPEAVEQLQMIPIYRHQSQEVQVPSVIGIDYQLPPPPQHYYPQQFMQPPPPPLPQQQIPIFPVYPHYQVAQPSEQPPHPLYFNTHLPSNPSQDLQFLPSTIYETMANRRQDVPETKDVEEQEEEEEEEEEEKVNNETTTTTMISTTGSMPA